MTKNPVKSSNIKEMGYYKKEKVMEVTFKTGGVYSFSNVSKEDIDALNSAPSFGKKLHELKLARKWEYKKL